MKLNMGVPHKGLWLPFSRRVWRLWGQQHNERRSRLRQALVNPTVTHGHTEG